MFVAVNISSVEIEFAVLDDKAKIVSRFSISTQNKKTDDQYTTEIKSVFEYLQINKTMITHAAILSIVPKFVYIVSDFFKKYIKIDPIILSNNDIPLEHEEMNLQDIPVDIFAGCYACNKIYGSNIIFVNFDVIISIGACVNDKFCGYTVYPGMDILSTAIHEQISEYPEIVIKPIQDIYATNRYDALNCGIFNGAMGACDNIIANITSEYGSKQFKVIATCKNPALLQYSKMINIIDQDLRIKSIAECTKCKLLSV